MRLALLVLAALLSSAAPALAHEAHGPCQPSQTVGNGAVHVDRYNGECVGATVTIPLARCIFSDIHLIPSLHTPVLHGDGCETGVIVHRIEPGLLP